jgi:hypothetical protein
MRKGGLTWFLALMPNCSNTLPSIAPGLTASPKYMQLDQGQAELDQVYWPVIAFFAFTVEILISSGDATNADTHTLSPSLCS